MCNIFFFGGSTFNCGLHVSARDRVKRCTNVLLCTSEGASEIAYVWFCVNIYRARRKEKKRKQERKQINIIRYERAALFLLLSSSTRKELKRGNLNVARVTKETGSNLGISPPATRLGRVREEVCRRVQLYPARVAK